MTTDHDYDHFSQAARFHLRGEAVMVIVTSHGQLNN